MKRTSSVDFRGETKMLVGGLCSLFFFVKDVICVALPDVGARRPITLIGKSMDFSKRGSFCLLHGGSDSAPHPH